MTNDSKLVAGACPHDCPDTCGVISEVRDGRIVDFRADTDHPVTRGWLCAKVRPYLDHVCHPERLTHPLRRLGPKGSAQWLRISWDEALAEIAERWQGIIAEYGPESILPYSYSGTLGLVQLAVSNGRFWNRLGASQLQRTICDAAANMAIEATIGARYSQPYEAVLDSQLVILWGHNPVSTAPHFMPFLRQAQRQGTVLVVIDPRRTRSAKSADIHLAPRPGSDGALALGLAYVIVNEGLHDEGGLADHTVGWPEFKANLADFPPKRAAELTGLSQEQITDVARLYANRRPALIKISDGLNRNLNGGQNVRAVCCLPALTGQYGLRGGGLAYSTSGYLAWDSEAINKWCQSPSPGRVINMNQLGKALLDEALNPPIKSLFVFAANPVASTPNASRIVEGLKREDLFTVVHELFMTDTADYADIVLPATSQLEQTDLHKAYGHTYLTYNRPAIAPLAESKSNWAVMRLLAQAMGFDEPYFSQEEEDVIAEVLYATAAHNPALRGISLDRLQREGTVPLAIDDPIPFADGHFPTPSGKVELYSQALAQRGLSPLPAFDDAATDDGGLDHSQMRLDHAESLVLLSGAAHHFVSSSLANQSGLMAREGSPYLEVHPDDAEARGIADGDAVVVENGRGWLTLRAVVTDAVRPGVLASPKGFWPKLNGGRNVNWTTPDTLADMAGQSTFHSNRVWLRPASGRD